MGIDEERLCQECHNPLPIDAPPRTMFCPDCLAKRIREQRKRYRETHAEQLREEGRKNREYCKAHGICIRCQHENVVPGKRYCKACDDYVRDYNKVYKLLARQKKKT